MIYDKFVETAQKKNVSKNITIVFERQLGGSNVFIYVDEYMIDKFETNYTLNDVCLAKDLALKNEIEFKTCDGLHPRIKFVYTK